MKFVYLAIVALVILLFSARLISGEDDWICANGKWIKHGKPLTPAPTTQCGKKNKPLIPKDEKTCLENNGIWKRVAINPRETCNLKTKDYKQDCTDHTQCEGMCLADLTKEEMNKGMNGKLNIRRHGQCSEWVTVYGCRGYVTKGQVKFMCLD